MANNTTSRAAGIPIAEGVRFQIGEAAVYAVRNEQKDISVRVRRESQFFRNLFNRIPFVRGVARLLRAGGLLMRGLNQASQMNPQSVIRGGHFAQGFAELFRTTPQALCALLTGLLIPIILGACMVGLPMLVEYGLSYIEDLPRFAVNAVCCLFRIGGAVLSICLIARLKVVNRLCMYRGAAGKVTNAYEAYGPDLTHEEVLLSSRLTDSSDGAFAIVVMILSLIGFACFRTDNMAMQLAVRLGIILAAAAVSNELILPLERAKPESLGAMLRRPLVGLQHLFTIEPHNQMIEVALCAFRAAYENDFS